MPPSKHLRIDKTLLYLPHRQRMRHTPLCPICLHPTRWNPLLDLLNTVSAYTDSHPPSSRAKRTDGGDRPQRAGPCGLPDPTERAASREYSVSKEFIDDPGRADQKTKTKKLATCPSRIRARGNLDRFRAGTNSSAAALSANNQAGEPKPNTILRLKKSRDRLQGSGELIASEEKSEEESGVGT